MKLVTPFLAGAALLAFGSVAQAEEPLQLTDAQMDHVAAGTAGGSWSSEGDAFVEVRGFSDNIPYYFAEADLTTRTTCFSGTCTTQQNTFAVVDGF